jgi:uncharacterized membrane protein
MRTLRSRLFFFPLALPFLIAAAVLIALLFTLIELGAIEYAYEKIGIHGSHVFGLLLLSLLGSYVNIPVAELPAADVSSDRLVSVFGMRYVIPVVEERPSTIVAVNVGGAVIPTLLSLYLVVTTRAYVPAVFGVVIVTSIVHLLARPVQGLGIAVPVFVPPLVAAAAALWLSSDAAPCVAYVAGSLGTLIGADLLNLGKLQGLGAPIASIGGAGTFDGIFLTGVLAALLA